MDRRPLSLLLASGLLLAAPAASFGASLDALLADSGSGGTLSASPAGLTAQASGGTLSDTPTETKGSSGSDSGSGSSGSSSSSGSKATSAAKATANASVDALPFTGSDPRATLLLGVAALLAGAGLRLRTGDARDY